MNPPIPTMHRPGTPGGPAVSDASAIGDGTTVRSRARTRWQMARLPLILLLVLVGTAILSSLLTARTSAVPFAPDNPRDTGARALAEILRERGVRIDYVRTTSDALAQAQAGTTLLVVGTMSLFGDQVTDLRDVAADLVVVGPNPYDVQVLTGGDLTGGEWDSAQETHRTPACDDPDAIAAEGITTGEYGVVAATPAATTCFPADDDPSAGAYGVVERDGRRVVVITDASLMTNERLSEDGNAALLLRALGHHDRLTWYLPSYNETGLDVPSGPGVGDLLPGSALVIGAQLLLVVLALALWRGRRLGRVVTEPLPVTVRASETTRGRGRLYRRSRSLGHAAAALRAGAARRAAARLGLPRSAGAAEVIDALARATGRSTEQIAGLLYGPPPNDDAALLDLARQLDELESEVHRT